MESVSIPPYIQAATNPIVHNIQFPADSDQVTPSQISLLHVQEFKALLHTYRARSIVEGGSNELKFYIFMPTRTLTWKGSVVAYKVSSLLCDAKGYLTIRLDSDELESIIDAVSLDKDFRINTTDATFLMHPSVECYHISLRSTTPMVTPLSSLRFDVYKLPMELEERVKCDWTYEEVALAE